MLQWLVVGLMVLGATAYAAWTLMPAALRRTLATAMLGWPLPAPLAAKVRKAAQGATGCGCDGCDRSPVNKAAVPDAAKPLTFHPRVKR